MRRFFISPASIIGEHVILPETESRHIAAVLRLSAGITVELFDTTGMVYAGLLETVEKKKVTVRILSRRQEQPDSHTPPLSLVQGMLKGNKMDLVVRIATEMGVHTFQPLLTRFSERRINAASQAERWQRIMVAACKQCGRNTPMIIAPSLQLAALSLPDFATGVLLWEQETRAHLDRDMLTGAASVFLMLGPEGGFDPEEISQARQLGFTTYSLGSRILRAESATLAAVAIIQHHLGAFQQPDST